MNALRSLFLSTYQDPLVRVSRKARALVQPTSGALEIAAEIGYKRELCAAYPGSGFGDNNNRSIYLYTVTPSNICLSAEEDQNTIKPKDIPFKAKKILYYTSNTLTQAET